MSEQWKYIPGYEGLYIVSNMGKIKSMGFFRSGKYLERKKPMLLKPARGHNGYLFVELRNNKIGKLKRVSRIVLEAFVGPCPDGHEACHFPHRDKENNRLDNLRWDTRSNNEKDKLIHGTDCRGEKNTLSKLTEKEVIKIRGLLKSKNHTHRAIADIYGVARTTITSISNACNWSWL